MRPLPGDTDLTAYVELEYLSASMFERQTTEDDNATFAHAGPSANAALHRVRPGTWAVGADRRRPQCRPVAEELRWPLRR